MAERGLGVSNGDEPTWAEWPEDVELVERFTGAGMETAAGAEMRAEAHRRSDADFWAGVPDCPDCGAKLADGETHVDGTPRCVQVYGQLGTFFDAADRHLAKLQRVVERSPEPQKAKPSRWRSGGSRPKPPPPFRRFGIWR